MELNDLLHAWEEYPDTDKTAYLDTLCQQYPELADLLRARTAAMRKFGAMISPEVDDQPPEIPGLINIEVHGRGGMGIVYRAWDQELQRTVAVKRPKQIHVSREATARFHREAQILGKLSHPNIVPVYQSRLLDDIPYYVMDFVEGGSLKEEAGRFANAESALALMEDIARAAHYAHERDVIHRDLKPSNILIRAKDGRGLIADFGVASLRSVPEPERHPLDASATERDDLTQDGRAIGTSKYMAPEQAKSAARVDGRADVYSLGVILRELFAGELLAKKDEQPQPLRLPLLVRRQFRNLIAAATAEDVEQRLPSALALAEGIARLRQRMRVAKGVRRALPYAAAVLLVVGGLAASQYWDVPFQVASAAKLRELESTGRTEFITPATGEPLLRVTEIGRGSTYELADSPFNYRAFGISVLEFIDGLPLQRTRITCEIRENFSTGNSEVGLFLGGNHGRSANGTPQFLCHVLTFSDHEQSAAFDDEENPVLDFTHFGMRKLEFRENYTKLWASSHSYLNFNYQNPRLRDTSAPRLWRQLVLDVDWPFISVTFDGNPLMNGRKTTRLNIPGKILPANATEWKGAVGLYLDNADISIRNLVVESY